MTCDIVLSFGSTAYVKLSGERKMAYKLRNVRIFYRDADVGKVRLFVITELHYWTEFFLFHTFKQT